MTKTRILVVEDELIVARDLKNRLVDLGYEPVADTSRAEDVVGLARKCHPNLVLMDVRLGGAMDGITAAQQVREQLHIPVVFLTAYAEDTTLERAKTAEPYGYIIKPFEDRELRTVIEMALYKHRSEMSLLESRGELSAILQTAMDGFWILDNQGRILEANAAICAMLGYSREELVGMHVWKIDADETPEQNRAHMEVIRAEGQARFECRHRHKSGKLMNVEASVKYLPAAGGRYYAFMRDITESKRAQMALMHRKAELAAIYDHAPLIMCLLDEESRIVRMNQAAIEFAGAAPVPGSEMRGGNLFGCLHAVEDPRGCGFTASCHQCAFRTTVLDTIQTGRTNRRVEAKPLFVRGQQVREFTVLISSARLTIQGQTRVLLCLEDITQSRIAEQRIRTQAALLDISQDAIIVLNLDNTIRFWNQGAQALYGYPTAEAEGRDAITLLSAPSEEAVKTARLATMDQGSWRGELAQITRDGRRLVTESRWTLMRDPAGEPVSFLVVNTDITEKSNLQKQLLRAQRLESIGTLASGIAHDLNNVLSPILMVNHLLREEIKDPAPQHLLDTVESCARRGGDILKQVLTFARGIEGERVPIQGKHLLRELHSLLRETFPRSITLEMDFCVTPWTFLGDPTQVQQVLMNLCVNARDAMPSGGLLSLRLENITLEEGDCGFHLSARPGRWVQFIVSDTGTGIPSEILDQIFDPFFTTKPLGQGTGLGLATVLGIVDKHQGFIHVLSEPGKGSTFQVFLPAAPESPIATVESAVQESIPRGNGELILVVDDESSVRSVVSRILMLHGYRVLQAKEGQEGSDLYRQNASDVRVVVTDLMMPGRDGISMVREIRNTSPNLPIIAMSGLGEDALRAQAEQAGVGVLILKPFSPKDLLMALGRFLS